MRFQPIICLAAMSAVVVPDRCAAEPVPNARAPLTDMVVEPLPEGAIARFGAMPDESGYSCAAVAFAPGGRLMASGYWSNFGDYKVHVWNWLTREPVRVFAGHQGPVGAVAFALDGLTLATLSDDGTARLWDIRKCEQVRKLEIGERAQTADGQNAYIFALAFSPDGKKLYTGFGSIRAWDIETGKQDWAIEFAKEPAFSRFRLSTDGKVLVAAALEAANDGTIRMWNANDGKELPAIKTGAKAILSVAISPDSVLVASAEADGMLRLWDRASGKEKARTNAVEARNLAFSPDCKTLAAIWRGAEIREWSVADLGAKPKTVGKTRVPAHFTHPLVFTPDGRHVTALNTLDMEVWDRQTARMVFRNALSMVRCSCAVFSPDGNTIAAGSDAKYVSRWDAWTGRYLGTLTDTGSGYSHGIDHVACAPDGKTILASGQYGYIGRWNAITGKRLERPAIAVENKQRALTTPLTPDARLIVTRPPDKDEYLICEADGGKVRQRIAVGPREVAFALSPDGKLLVTRAEYEKVAYRVWDVESGREVRAGDDHWAYGFVFAPDGRALAYITTDQQSRSFFRIVDARTGHAIRTFPRQQSDGSALVFSPDGRVLASVADRDQVRLWEVASGTERRRLIHKNPTPQHWVHQLALSADGKRLVSAGGLCHVWDVTETLTHRAEHAAAFAKYDRKELWRALAHVEAARAWEVMRLLIAAPESVAFLRERLMDETKEGEHVARLIRQLDADSFREREEATKELAALASRHAETLRRALAAPSSAEAEGRLKKIVAKAGIADPGFDYRQIRCVEVLETIGSAEARELLRDLAKLNAKGVVADQAKTALGRLEKADR